MLNYFIMLWSRLVGNIYPMKDKMFQEKNKDVSQSITRCVPEYPMDGELWDILLHMFDWVQLVNY